MTDTDTIAVTVNAVNDPPTATTQTFAVQTNMQRTIGVTLSGAGGPTDPDTGDAGYTATFSLASSSRNLFAVRSRAAWRRSWRVGAW